MLAPLQSLCVSFPRAFLPLLITPRSSILHYLTGPRPSTPTRIPPLLLRALCTPFHHSILHPRTVRQTSCVLSPLLCLVASQALRMYWCRTVFYSFLFSSPDFFFFSYFFSLDAFCMAYQTPKLHTRARSIPLPTPSHILWIKLIGFDF